MSTSKNFDDSTIAMLDALIATSEGQKLIQQRWHYAQQLAESKDKADRKAAPGAWQPFRR